MKYMITGIVGLLMIAINLAGYFSRDNTIADASYTSGQMADDNTINQTGCNHDCAACGKCFPPQEIEKSGGAYGLNGSSSYNLIIKSGDYYE